MSIKLKPKCVNFFQDETHCNPGRVLFYYLAKQGDQGREGGYSINIYSTSDASGLTFAGAMGNNFYYF